MTKPAKPNNPKPLCPRCFEVIRPTDDIVITSGGYVFHSNCEPENEAALKKVIALANGWRPDKRREVYFGTK